MEYVTGLKEKRQAEYDAWKARDASVKGKMGAYAKRCIEQIMQSTNIDTETKQ